MPSRCSLTSATCKFSACNDDLNIERLGVEIIADDVTFLSRGKSAQRSQTPAGNDDDNDIPSWTGAEPAGGWYPSGHILFLDFSAFL